MNGMLKHLLSQRRAEHVPGFYGEIHLSFESRAFQPLALQSSFPEQSSFPLTLWITNSKLILLIVKIHLTVVSAIIATGLKFSAWKDTVDDIMICKLKAPGKFSSLTSINQSINSCNYSPACRSHKQSGITAIILQEILSCSEILPRGTRWWDVQAVIFQLLSSISKICNSTPAKAKISYLTEGTD